MKIALFGATGGTGRALIEQALAAGHSVTALARDPAKLSAQDGLTIIQGDARDAAAVAATLAGADVAISTMGNFIRKANTEISDATRTITGQMNANGPRRLVVITTIGCGDSLRQLRSFMFRMVIRTVARHIWADRNRQDEVVRHSGLDWTIVRPGGLRDGPRTGEIQVIGGGDPQPKKILINRADVADYCLQAAADPALAGQTVCIFS